MGLLTVRQIDSADKAWLRAEAERRHISMEEMVRRLIHEGREKATATAKPSEIVRRYFGHDRGIDLGDQGDYAFDPVEFNEE
ncbi:FitA-like ribbon-helix-helix domain-containing protein [Endothiovibrio diazotrophicus]